jgi:hypothetical protein
MLRVSLLSTRGCRPDISDIGVRFTVATGTARRDIAVLAAAEAMLRLFIRRVGRRLERGRLLIRVPSGISASRSVPRAKRPSICAPTRAGPPSSWTSPCRPPLVQARPSAVP